MKTRIRAHALALGFDDCRFTTAAPPETAPRLQQWLEAGRHGGMHYLERNAAKRINPDLVLPGARTLIVVAAAYGDGGESRAFPRAAGSAATVDSRGVVARYARFADYHHMLGERLNQLSRFVDEAGGPGTRSLWYVDTGPILERDLAQRAGVGFIGKHTNLIGRGLGNWFLLGEILTTLNLEPDPPERNHCGTCTRCLAACPTHAILAPFELDARRCISYLTIELKGSIPMEFRAAIGNRIFGCDDCLAACPWNRFARLGQIMQPQARSDLATPDLVELLSMDDQQFKARFSGTPLERSKRRGLRRNVCVALGNVGGPEALPALVEAAADPDPLVAEHAAWAAAEIRRRCP